MMNIDEKKKLALEVIARLKQAYPVRTYSQSKCKKD